MKPFVLALGLFAALAPAAPASAQRGEGHIIQRPQPSADCARGARNCRAVKPKAAAPSSQFGLGPNAGAGAASPMGLPAPAGGAGDARQPDAFNTQMKPLGGPGYLPGQR